MKRFIGFSVLAAMLIMSASAFSAESKIPAFPGAEGGGMWTTGARGSQYCEIYHVTKLTDDGTEGTFRQAVSQDNRVIVFDIAGNIELKSSLKIKSNNLTILGQTAPGGGVCIKDAPVFISGSNIIMRYMRFRLGTKNGIDGDALGGGNNAENLIIDHCSASWSTDEVLSIYAVRNLTVQWCIIANPLDYSIHDEGEGIQHHGFGGIWGGVNSSYHHNLVANCVSRYPLVGTSETVASFQGGADTDGLLDIRNNVMYNWKNESSHGGQNGMRVNLVNNYYKEGPASKQLNRFYKMLEGSGAGDPSWGTDIAVIGNYYDPRSMSAAVMTINGDNKQGVFSNNAGRFKIFDYSDNDPSHGQYIKDYPITTQTAADAYESVLKYAGANRSRDVVDNMVLEGVKTRTAKFGENGIINSPEEMGGWPELFGSAKADYDGDGIPDIWEDENGLNKYDAADAVYLNSSGYLNIEEYANSLAVIEGNEPRIWEENGKITGVNSPGGVLIAVAYDAGGILEHTAYVEVPSGTFTVDLNRFNVNEKNIKIMFWRDIITMEPVCDSIDL